MDATNRRTSALSLGNIDDIPPPCRSCVFWEFGSADAKPAEDADDPALEKEAWVSATLLEWGSCGLIAYAGDAPVGYVLYAPPAYLPRALAFPSGPVGADALHLATARVVPAARGMGFGRTLVATAARALAGRGFRALEAFGDARNKADRCVLPAGFLLAMGFRTVRPHRHWPRLRLDLSPAGELRAEVRADVDLVVGRI